MIWKLPTLSLVLLLMKWHFTVLSITIITSRNPIDDNASKFNSMSQCNVTNVVRSLHTVDDITWTDRRFRSRFISAYKHCSEIFVKFTMTYLNVLFIWIIIKMGWKIDFCFIPNIYNLRCCSVNLCTVTIQRQGWMDQHVLNICFSLPSTSSS